MGSFAKTVKLVNKLWKSGKGCPKESALLSLLKGMWSLSHIPLLSLPCSLLPQPYLPAPPPQVHSKNNHRASLEVFDYTNMHLFSRCRSQEKSAWFKL